MSSAGCGLRSSAARGHYFVPAVDRTASEQQRPFLPVFNTVTPGEVEGKTKRPVAVTCERSRDPSLATRRIEEKFTPFFPVSPPSPPPFRRVRGTAFCRQEQEQEQEQEVQGSAGVAEKRRKRGEENDGAYLVETAAKVKPSSTLNSPKAAA